MYNKRNAVANHFVSFMNYLQFKYHQFGTVLQLLLKVIRIPYHAIAGSFRGRRNVDDRALSALNTRHSRGSKTYEAHE